MSNIPALETSLWWFQYHHCVSRQNYWKKVCTLSMYPFRYDRTILQRERSCSVHSTTCIFRGSAWSASTVLMKPCLLTPTFSHSSSLSPWVTVARLQPRPVGPWKPRPERLAVWVTAPPPTCPYKGVLTTLALLFGPQNTSQPPIWLFAEKGRAELRIAEQKRLLEGGGCGWSPVGSVVSVWTLKGVASCLLVEGGDEGQRAVLKQREFWKFFHKDLNTFS